MKHRTTKHHRRPSGGRPSKARSQKRAAIYTVEGGASSVAARGSDLLSFAKHARDAGLRVVTMSHEQMPNSLQEFEGPKFQKLAARLNSGEFDVIVAADPRGGLMMIGGPGRRGVDQ